MYISYNIYTSFHLKIYSEIVNCMKLYKAPFVDYLQFRKIIYSLFLPFDVILIKQYEKLLQIFYRIKDCPTFKVHVTVLNPSLLLERYLTAE